MVCILLGFKIIAEARHTHSHAYRSAKVLNPTPSTSTMAKDIVLGASVQLTGPVANIGRYYRDAYQFCDRQDQHYVVNAVSKLSANPRAAHRCCRSFRRLRGLRDPVTATQ